MKTLLIILMLFSIGLFSDGDTNTGHRIVYTMPKLKEPAIKEISNKVALQLHILQTNVKKYENVIKKKSIKDIVIVIPDTAIVYKK